MGKDVKKTKIPRVIMHNSVSLDGSFTDLGVNMGPHYQIAGEYKTDTTLVDSETIKTGKEEISKFPVVTTRIQIHIVLGMRYCFTNIDTPLFHV